MSHPPRTADDLAQTGHVLVREKKWDEAISLFRRAVERDPGHGVAYGAMGYCLEQLGQADEAIAAYRAGGRLQPDNAEIVFNLGNVLRSQGKLDDARAAYQRTLTIDRAHVRALNNLGTVYQMQGEPDEAIQVYLRALAIKPDYAEARNNLGSAHIAKNEIPEALTAYRESLAMDATLERTHFNQGIARLLAGDLPKGWEGYEHRPEPAGRPRTKADVWHGGQPLKGQSILLTCEQGLGDTLQFVRYAPLLVRCGATVHLQVQPAVRRLLAMMPGIASVTAVGESAPAHSLQCSLLSLPHAFKTSLDTIPAEVPYLRPPPDAPSLPADRPGQTGPRIGVVWAGNPSHKHDRWRSIPLPLLAAALQGCQARFYSLQKDLTGSDAATLALHPQFADCSTLIDDFADTAGLLAQLDLVITVDSAVAHLAGALGRPVWILLPFSPDWRWMLGRDNSPWYPTAQLFRQPAPGDWQSVLAKVHGAIAAGKASPPNPAS